MTKPVRLVLIGVGAVVALLVIVAISLPLFLNADSFRAKIESTATQSLGRKVTIGKLNLSSGRGAGGGKRGDRGRPQVQQSAVYTGRQRDDQS